MLLEILGWEVRGAVTFTILQWGYKLPALKQNISLLFLFSFYPKKMHFGWVTGEAYNFLNSGLAAQFLFLIGFKYVGRESHANHRRRQTNKSKMLITQVEIKVRLEKKCEEVKRKAKKLAKSTANQWGFLSNGNRQFLAIADGLRFMPMSVSFQVQCDGKFQLTKKTFSNEKRHCRKK